MHPMNLHESGDRILNYLHVNGARYASEIAHAVGLPTASVRRWIGILRDRGFNITTGPGGYTFKFES